MKLIFVCFLFLIALFLLRCASPSVPTGGEKDATPPVLIRSTPESKSTQYKNQEIELEFDELIRVENLKQELLITPSTKGDYQSKLTKTGIKLTFDQPFQDNTTYTLNFRNAFVDLAEKNIARDVKIVFSTGKVIDSLLIAGNVRDPLRGNGVLNAVVSLYQTNDTATVFKDKPYYSTRTDSAGNFSLENIRNGSYRVYAVEDKNGNLTYDQATEKVAFATEPINLEKGSASNVQLNLVKIDKRPPKVDNASASENKYTLEFDEGLVEAKVTLPNDYQSIPYMREGEKKIVFFKGVSANDSIPVQITALDSAGNSYQDTVKIKFAPEKSAPDRKGRNEPKVANSWSVGTTPKDGEEVEKDLVFAIRFSKPIRSSEPKGIRILADTISLVPLTEENYQWDAYKTLLTVKAKVNAKREIRVEIPKGTFLSIENDTSQVIKTNHKIKELENYGSIGGSITTAAASFIIELLTVDFKSVAQKRDTKTYQFDFLNAGDYLIRVISDDNKNGKWDSGDIEAGELPEKIVLFSDNSKKDNQQVIKLKQNWELQEINVTLQ
ncbi:MAG: Ig-like domain-containing protein [Ferruginibacter sp.]|nr:Ig-like domain-containing protein [Cytophagales bacterium]